MRTCQHFWNNAFAVATIAKQQCLIQLLQWDAWILLLASRLAMPLSQVKDTVINITNQLKKGVKTTHHPRSLPIHHGANHFPMPLIRFCSNNNAIYYMTDYMTLWLWIWLSSDISVKTGLIIKALSHPEWTEYWQRGNDTHQIKNTERKKEKFEIFWND